MIWGNISRSVNGENVLGGVAYKNKVSYYTPPHSMRFFILIEITVVTRDVVSYNTVGTGV